MRNLAYLTVIGFFCLLIGIISSLRKNEIASPITSMIPVEKKGKVNKNNETPKLEVTKQTVANVPIVATKAQEPIQPSSISLSKMIQTEALHLYDFSEDPKLTEERIKRRAGRLNPQEIEELRALVLNEAADKDQRLVAIYYLKASGAKSHDQLKNIFFSQSSVFAEPATAHSVAEANQVFENSIRLMALEGIEDNIFSSRGQLKIGSVSKLSPANSYLGGMLKIAQAGEHARRPLLREFIDKSLRRSSL